ncbi:MAG: hypothetical protein CM1200mP1_14730 [Candidatus Neomarinimicrobiota bacterium]|nr:MAG: hypothetical protein CM1200mP1_14730 [Candidatus Neomarinimicrobiota bacterium]
MVFFPWLNYCLKDLPQIIFQRFNEVALTICEGQGLDKEFEHDTSISINQYLSMISKKTGAPFLDYLLNWVVD